MSMVKKYLNNFIKLIQIYMIKFHGLFFNAFIYIPINTKSIIRMYFYAFFTCINTINFE